MEFTEEKQNDQNRSCDRDIPFEKLVVM